MIQETIESKLTKAFEPQHLQVINESHGHNVAKGAETHFKVVIVSTQFEDSLSVKRHQSVYKVLADELQAGVHALAIHTYTPAEWTTAQGAPESPDCMGGARK